MINEEIRDALFQLRDEDYRAFQGKLIPTVSPEDFIGVRTPELRRLAGQLANRADIGAFLEDLPHRYFDENQLHAFVISEIRDFDRCVEAVDRFLPFIDNWATCDQLSPKTFRRHKIELLERIRIWIASDRDYTVRFAIGMLMAHYLDGDYDEAYPEMVANVRSGEYYVNMMIAWYFATALAKQYESALSYLEGRRLEAWTHNKAVQKAIESRRISQERKDYLKTLKV